MLPGISIPVFSQLCWLTPARCVEPVCPATCDRDQFPPTNAFALPPAPFAKFLERENIIDRFQRSPPRPIPCAYTPTAKPCTHSREEEHLGRRIDILA